MGGALAWQWRWHGYAWGSSNERETLGAAAGCRPLNDQAHRKQKCHYALVRGKCKQDQVDCRLGGLVGLVYGGEVESRNELKSKYGACKEKAQQQHVDYTRGFYSWLNVAEYNSEAGRQTKKKLQIVKMVDILQRTVCEAISRFRLYTTVINLGCDLV